MPVIISPDLVTSPAPGAVPLDHPRILWDDVARRGSPVASSEEVGFEAENAVDYLTWDFWRPASLPANLEIATLAAETVDYCLIAAHTLGSSGVSVTPQYFDGAIWQDLASQVSPGNDRVLVFLFPEQTASRFRVLLEGGSVPSVGVLMFGQALATERKLYRNHSPVNLSRRTVIRPNTSEGGHWLGRSIQRAGVATDVTISNLTAQWVRDNLEDFIVAAREYPFGWAWRPSEFPDEVAYVWVNQDIQPVNSGPRDFMSFSMAVEGHIE